MKKISLISISIFIVISCQSSLESTVKSIELTEGWEFKKANDENWMIATVPGCVHTDLLNNGVIKDPFVGLNEHDLQWIDKEDWEYRTVFNV